MNLAKLAAGVALVALLSGLALAAWRFASPVESRPTDQPWRHVPPPARHVDHASLIPDGLKTGPDVTKACLSCHPNAAKEVMATNHWTWAGHRVRDPQTGEVRSIGKLNVINNFCIAALPNIKACSACHAGYGWEDPAFDFSREENVDCLVCHDRTNTYQKGLAGIPTADVDLTAVARSVGRPTRLNCGQCHFKGGGADAVKHGDLDGTMYFPPERIDVHMGRLRFECVDCHQAKDHRIPGCAMSVCTEKVDRVSCTDCHSDRPHGDDRLDFHTATVACQTCHIPKMAIDAPTKMYWDWSAAGRDDIPEDPHVYLKKKGRFVYAQDVVPEYYWYNGRSQRYLTGEKIDPAKVVLINRPLGGPGDPAAKIWPFKVHRGRQIYDRKYEYLLTPRTWGPGGFWTEFDWDKACRLGSQDMGLPYSGEYGFVDTEMYWPLSHMVQAKEQALQCADCHGPEGRLDWGALGYPGDPMYRGDRRAAGLLTPNRR
ncbi:MAG: tetrathionate reductase family octaheme c-type cytochrome [Thermogutta sp.]